MAEKYYTFIKENRVENTLVFSEKNDELAQRIVNENDYDSFFWLDEREVPHRWSFYDSKMEKFIEPKNEYLVKIGIQEQAEVVPEPVDSTVTQ